jgi:centromeric protein E
MPEEQWDDDLDFDDSPMKRKMFKFGTGGVLKKGNFVREVLSDKENIVPAAAGPMAR